MATQFRSQPSRTSPRIILGRDGKSPLSSHSHGFGITLAILVLRMSRKSDDLGEQCSSQGTHNMKLSLLASAALCASFLTLGCNKSEPGGVPGTDSSFTLSPPQMSTHLKPKESKVIKIDVNRKDSFNEAVVFMAKEVPNGLKVDEKSKTAAAGTKEVAFTVTAEENAQPGDYVIKVQAKPEKTGKETLTDVKVTVDKP